MRRGRVGATAIKASFRLLSSGEVSQITVRVSRDEIGEKRGDERARSRNVRRSKTTRGQA
jgi:hypothetical protein